MNEISVLLRRDKRERILLSLVRHSQKTAICKPGKELSSETKPFQILIWDFQTPDLLFKSSSLWYFVMAALETNIESIQRKSRVLL